MLVRHARLRQGKIDWRDKEDFALRPGRKSRYARDRIGKIVVPPRSVIDGVFAASSRAPLQPAKLRDRLWVIEQVDTTRVHQRQERQIEFAAVHIGWPVLDSVDAKSLSRPFASVAIAGHVAENSFTTLSGENGALRSPMQSTTTRPLSLCAIANVIESDEPPLGSTNPK
jgi:hypothetical protein